MKFVPRTDIQASPLFMAVHAFNMGGAYSRAEIEAALEKMVREARANFWAFRQLINPRIITGWYQEVAANHLQQWYADLMDGKRPKLVIQAPPQHGKSDMIVDFIAWLAGRGADLQVIYASYSENLGIRANLKLQRIYDSRIYSRIFPEIQINKSNVVTVSRGAQRNRFQIQYVGKRGRFYNTTVNGSITGESLDVGVIDDPIKSRTEANSPTVRNKTWDWFTNDFFTRFSDTAGMLAILTRWHVDDPIGRMITEGMDVKVLTFAAIAEQDEKYRKKGEALFPQFKSLDFLLERKKLLHSSHWVSLYQQRPSKEGSTLVNGAWFKRYEKLPPLSYRFITADTAQKAKKENDRSALACWGVGKDGILYLIDLIAGRWEAPELETRARDFWNKHLSGYDRGLHGSLRAMYVEDKVSGTGLIQYLKNGGVSGSLVRIPVIGVGRGADKYTRLSDVLVYIQNGFIMIPISAGFSGELVGEFEEFRADMSHDHDDLIDVTVDAIVIGLIDKSSADVWGRAFGKARV